MHIISFDVGIKNLAFCDICFEHSKTTVNKMCIIDVSGKTCCDKITNVVQKLDEHFNDEHIFDVVVIENQPSFKNPMCKTIQTAIHTWFVTTKRCNKVALCPPSQKNKLCCTIYDETYPSNYRESKKQTIRAAKKMLGELFFSGKSDDVADAFVQSIYFFLNTTNSVSKEGFNKYIIL
jgi:hypothetical protein